MKEFIIAIAGLNIGCLVGFLLGRVGIPTIKAEVSEFIDKAEAKIDQIKNETKEKVEEIKEKIDEIRN